MKAHATTFDQLNVECSTLSVGRFILRCWHQLSDLFQKDRRNRLSKISGNRLGSAEFKRRMIQQNGSSDHKHRKGTMPDSPQTTMLEIDQRLQLNVESWALNVGRFNSLFPFQKDSGNQISRLSGNRSRSAEFKRRMKTGTTYRKHSLPSIRTWHNTSHTLWSSRDEIICRMSLTQCGNKQPELCPSTGSQPETSSGLPLIHYFQFLQGH